MKIHAFMPWMDYNFRCQKN